MCYYSVTALYRRPSVQSGNGLRNQSYNQQEVCLLHRPERRQSRSGSSSSSEPDAPARFARRRRAAAQNAAARTAAAGPSRGGLAAEVHRVAEGGADGAGVGRALLEVGVVVVGGPRSASCAQLFVELRRRVGVAVERRGCAGMCRSAERLDVACRRRPLAGRPLRFLCSAIELGRERERVSSPWLFCSILYSMLQCYIASIRCYSTT